MILPHNNDWVRGAGAALSDMLDSYRNLPFLSLSLLEPSSTALILVDLVNGFAKEGPLASPRIGSLVGASVELLRRCRQRGITCIAFADTHTPDSLELQSYPSHCLRGSEESALCAELEAVGGYLRIDKDSTNGFVEPAFERWRDEHPAIFNYLVVGDCTDICVSQFALTAKAYYNSRGLSSRVMVPVTMVDTFDGGTHHADLLNVVSLYMMQGGGVELYQSILE